MKPHLHELVFKIVSEYLASVYFLHERHVEYISELFGRFLQFTISLQS